MSSHNSSSEFEDPPEFHDKSKWEEPPGDSLLTLWEVHRVPRAPPVVVEVDPDHKIRLPVELLHPDFRCPICSGYLKKTTTVMECMHRFCEVCIEDSIRRVKKECPTCRIHIPSRRSLRSDKRFDKLIECILGDVEEQDQKETRQIELFNQHNLLSNTMQTRQCNRRQPTYTSLASETKEKMTAPFVPSAPIYGFTPSPLVRFFLVRHPHETCLDPLLKDNLRMSGEAPLVVLQTFLSRKLSYHHGPASDIQILCYVKSEFMVLHPNLTLKGVEEQMFSPDETMVLFYRKRTHMG